MLQSFHQLTASQNIPDKKETQLCDFPVKFFINQSNSKCHRISISDRILLKFTLSIHEDVFNTNAIGATGKHVLVVIFHEFRYIKVSFVKCNNETFCISLEACEVE